MFFQPTLKSPGQDFTFSPSSVESNSLSDACASLCVSNQNFGHISRLSSDMFNAASAAASTEKHQQDSIKNTSNTTAAVTAAPISQTTSLAASIDKPIPPPPSSAVDNTADSVKMKNQNVRRNVYISGIPPVYRSEEFRQLCMQFGRVEAAKLCVDNRNAPTKAYGFALYYSEESAAACIRGLNGSFLQGRCVQARLADSHATPQPLGDEGSAANTTIPPPSHQHHRYDQRGSNNGNRKNRNSNSNSNNNNAPVENSVAGAGNYNIRRGVSLPSAGAMSRPGITSLLPTPPYTAFPTGAVMITQTTADAPAPAAAATAVPTTSVVSAPGMPMDMSAYYQFIPVLPGAAVLASAAPTALTTPPPPQTASQNSNNVAAPATNTHNVSPSNCSPAAEGGFGAVGTPVTGPLVAGATASPHGPTLSPASMALSPPLLSSHSTESGSVSPNASRVTTSTGTAATTAINATVANFIQAQGGVSPYQIAYLSQSQEQLQPQQLQQAQQQQQQTIMPNLPAGQVAIMTGTSADGTPTFMYCSMPVSNGTSASAFVQAPTSLPGTPVMSAMPMAKPATGAVQLPGPVMYFTVPPQQQQVQQQQAAFLQMTHQQVPAAAAMTPNGLPGNYMMLENNQNNYGLQFQILRQM